MGLFPNLRTWFLANGDTGEILQGQFEPNSTTREVGGVWAEHTATSRQNSILQFLHGKLETLSVQVRLYARDILFNNVQDDLDKVVEWSQISKLVKRPPKLTFWLGDGHLTLGYCILESVSGITYGTPTFFGGIRDVTLTMNLKAYTEFDITATEMGETRYHLARERDYYEMLCYREYRNPNMGDIIRKRHPTKPNLQTADIVKLPSANSLRREKVEQKSIALQTSYGKKDTPQRALRLEMLELRNRTYVSHVIMTEI